MYQPVIDCGMSVLEQHNLEVLGHTIHFGLMLGQFGMDTAAMKRGLEFLSILQKTTENDLFAVEQNGEAGRNPHNDMSNHLLQILAQESKVPSANYLAAFGYAIAESRKFPDGLLTNAQKGALLSDFHFRFQLEQLGLDVLQKRKAFQMFCALKPDLSQPGADDGEPFDGRAAFIKQLNKSKGTDFAR